MSAPNTLLPSIYATAVTVSSEPPKRPKRQTSGDLRIGLHQYKLIRDDGMLRQEFPNTVELSPNTQITLYYKTSLFQRKKAQKIDTRHLFESFYASEMQDLSVAQDGIRVTFSCQPTETALPRTQTPEYLTRGVPQVEDCPHSRILVIGKSGVGKSSLINATFGIDKADTADLKRGKADIQEGLESSVNKRFILHDSLSFEPGDTDNYKTVKKFIRSRQTGQLKDRLHAVWFCVQTPAAGGRLLDVVAEDLFRKKKNIMGAIPLIVVYTKFDTFVDQLVMRLAASPHGELDDEGLTKLACSKAESSVRGWHNEIIRLTGESVPYAFVSTNENYKHTLQNLVELTHHQVGIR